MNQKNQSREKQLHWRFVFIESLLGILYVAIWYYLREGYHFYLMPAAAAYTIQVTAGMAFLLLAGMGTGFYLRDKYSRDSFYQRMEFAGIFLFVAYILFLCQHYWGQEMPSTCDNIIHYALATLTEVNLRYFHSLTGWCSAISTGIPLNELYPPGGSILVCLWRGLTLGLIARTTIYTFTVILSYFTFAFLLYAVVRKNFGRLAAIVFLLFMGCDSGLTFFGLQHSLWGGMWASQLAAGLSIWSFARFMEDDFPKNRLDGVLFTLAIGCSIVLHSFSFFLNILWIAFVLLYSLFIQPKEQRAAHPIWSVHKITFLLLGFGLSAFYLLPFLLSGKWVAPYGDWGVMMPEIGREILQGLYFRNSPVFFILLGLPAIMAAFFSRRPFVFVLSLYCLFNLFMGADICRLFFRFETARNFFIHMQVARLVSIARITAFMLVSGGIGIFCRWLWTKAAGDNRFGFFMHFFTVKIEGNRRAVFGKNILILAFMSGLFVFSFPYAYLGDHLATSFWHWKLRYLIDDYQAEPKFPTYWNNMLQALDHIPVQDTLKQPQVFFEEPLPPAKIGTAMGPWYPAIAITSNTMPIYAAEYMPAVILQSRFWGFDDWRLKIANVKYFIDTTAAPSADIKNVTGLVPVYQDKLISLYKWQGWDGQGWILHGQGTVQRLPAGQNSMRFAVQNTQPGALLRIGVSCYRKWKCFMNGKPAPQYCEALPGEPWIAGYLLGIPVENGDLTILYQEDWFDRVAVWISWFSILGLFICLLPFSWKKLSLLKIPSMPVVMRLINFCIVGGTGLLLLTTLLSPSEKKPNSIYYIGRHADQVGGFGYKPDLITDFCLGLEFTADSRHGKITEFIVTLLEPDGSVNPNYAWRTGLGPQWKIGVMDFWGNRCEQEDGALQLPDTPWQRLMLFINPPNLPLPPVLYHYRCKITYEDNTIQEF